MSKKPFFDLVTVPANDPDRKGPVMVGEVYLADNGQVVVLQGKDKRALSAIKGTSLFRRGFSKRIDPKWLKRRINEFAEHVQSTKLPRGPRRRQIDKDVAEIAKPIKRVRVRRKAPGSKEMA